MRKGLAALLLTALVFSGPARALAAASFVGIWFSAGQPDEPGVMSLIEFKADGTFREEFRKCEAGKVVGLQYQSGTWSVENGVEHTFTEMINGEATKVEDTYRVELLTDTQRRIRMEPQGYVFTSLRVSEFEFPDCASGV
jgi:activator of HSP90 ATPase